MITLRDYQKKTNEMLTQWFVSHKTGHPCVVLPTGSGKSIVIADFCKTALAKWGSTRILMLTATKELVEQNAEKMRLIWPNAPIGVYCAGLGRKEIEQITFGSIQSLRRKAEALGHIDLILIDECHNVSHRDEGGYRKLINQLTETNPKMRVIGYSATPFRLGHGLITDGDALFDDLIQPISILELIERGYLAPLRSKLTDMELNTAGVKKRGGEFVPKDLQAAVDTEDQNREAVAEVIRLANGRKAWLFFCTGVDHAVHVRDILRDNNIIAETVTGDTPKAERDRILSEFKAGRIQAVTNCGVLTTGFDYPDIDLIAMLRPTESKSLYCLDEKTEILTPEGWANINDDIKKAAAFDLKTSQIHWSDCEKIKRKLYKNESFYGICNPMINFAVTNKHNIVYSKRKFNGELSDWRLEKAEDLKGEFYIPVSGFQKSEGINLTDDEIRFLGLIITDGTINKANNAVTIYQSDRYDFCVNYILNVLKSCNLKYVNHKKNDDTNYGPRNHPMNCFTISKGKPRGTQKNKRGWGYLENYVSKNFLDVYEKMNRRQLKIFIESMWIGDGKKNIGVTWSPKTKTICSADLYFLNKLQSLCVRRGMRANIAKISDSFYNIHINTDQQVKSLVSKTSDSRPVFGKLKNINSSNVWCVEVDTGAIVTRRNGMVSVLGNCQMAGRGMRLKSHTDHCLVLDFAGVVSRHGPITSITVQKAGRDSKKAEKEQEPPTKNCEFCNEINATSSRVCTACGELFPAPAIKPLKLDTQHDIMGLKPTNTAIGEWDWSTKRSHNSGKEMIVIKYYSTNLAAEPIKEYLTLGYEGFAGARALRVFNDMLKVYDSSAAEMASLDLDSVCEMMNQLPPPVSIEYIKKGKFYEIKKRLFKEKVNV